MPKSKKPKSKITTESIRVQKPARFSDAEWGALTPAQKIRYAGNNALWKPGQTGRVRGKREKKREHKAMERIPLENVPHPLVTVSGPGLPAGGAGDPGAPGALQVGPAFEVADEGDAREIAQTNGQRLMVDAFKRAARAGQNLDPFDKHVYLALLQKVPGMKLDEDDGEETPAQAKANARKLRDFLNGPAQDGEYREVADGQAGT